MHVSNICPFNMHLYALFCNGISEKKFGVFIQLFITDLYIIGFKKNKALQGKNKKM